MIGVRPAGGLDQARLQSLLALADHAASALDRKDRDATKLCAMAKRFATDAGSRVANDALQLHGGYGYMIEHPIARAFADARVTLIYGGTTEIMKEVIGRSLGL